MIRSRLAPGRRRGLPDSRRGPLARLLIHREAMDRRLAVPDRFVAPIRRGRRRLRGEGTRRLRIANPQLYLTRRVGLWIEDSQVIAAFFKSSIDGAVGVHGRIILVTCDGVMQVDFWIGP